MGIFSDIGDFFGEVTGFGGNGNPNPHNTSPLAYAELYDQALGNINKVGTEGDLAKLRSGVGASAVDMLGDLENNAAGRKQNFMEDMNRGFTADVNSLARARGGTGTLKQALQPSGAMYDSQARATSRGLNELYSMAVNDLGNINSIQSGLYGQDMEKAQTGADLTMKELMSRRGQLNANNENTFNSEQAGRERRLNTLSGIVKGAGASSLFGGGK